MAIKYVPYFPNTSEGQAVLQNFMRTRRKLYYRDGDRVVNHIMRGMPLYEVQMTEQVGNTASDDNLVIHGECLSACAYLREQGREVDLVYIDPPFASGADYSKKVYLRRNPKVAAAIAQAEQELTADEMQAFEEKMYGDIWRKEDYLNWMYENLMAIRSVMSETASIYVHLDWHIGHYVKILMDEIFGEENFVNEITWKRNFAHGDTGQGAQHFGRISDYIFLYRKSDKFVFNGGYKPYDQEYINKVFTYKDPDGRQWQSLPITAPGGASKGNPYYEFMGVSRYWRFSKERLDDMLKSGKIYQSAPGMVPRQKGYLDESQGVPLQDIWDDIPAVQGQAAEYVSYSTQKPEALLERIIKASSDEGMVVADFFGGSGVTAAVAQKLGRRFIHNDINVNSIQTVRDRLVSLGASFQMMEVKDGVSLFRNPVQTMDKLPQLIPGLVKNPMLNRDYWIGSIEDLEAGMVPVYVPNLLDSSSRMLDKVTLNTIIRQALPDLADLPVPVKRVIVYYIDAEDLDELRQFIKEQNRETLIEVELRDLKFILDQVVMEDEAEWTLSQATDELFGGWCLTIDRFRSDRLQQIIDAQNQKSAQQDTAGKARHTWIQLSEEGLEGIEYVAVDCQCADKNAPWHSDAEIKIDRNGYVIQDGKKTQNFWNATVTCPQPPLRLKIRSICGDETIYVL